MENQLSRLAHCLVELAAPAATIADHLLSREEVTCLMGLVDVRRKGYLDLHDVYELAGSVSEGQLFALFKALDSSKTGEVREEDLMGAVGDPSSQSSNTSKQYLFSRFYKVIDAIKDRPATFTRVLSKFEFTQSELQGLFNAICSELQTRHPTTENVGQVLRKQLSKEGVEWGAALERTLKQTLPQVGPLRVGQFVAGWLSGDQQGREEEPIIAPATVEPTPQPITRSGQSPSIIYQPTQSSFQPKPLAPSRPVSTAAPRSQEWEDIQQSVNSTLSSIQQRRERLRQDSLERKKLIETVLSNKRQACGVEYAPTAAVPAPSRPSTPKTYLKHSASSQLLNRTQPIDSHGCTRPARVQTEGHYDLGRYQTQPDQPTPTFEGRHPLRYSRDQEIAEIIGKYSSKDNYRHSAHPRTLSKSKSSLLGQAGLEQGHYGGGGSRLTLGCKENVLRRAEEEAARKIEEIERKARMRVLEKRGGEWGRLQKCGLHY